MQFDTPLPIDDVLPQLEDHLARVPRAVLVAPPGAGKTTRVPLALLGSDALGPGRIIVLEPRRLAARAAAARMADSLGERVGDTIGLRVRMESRVSARTRIEIVTEGVFARMILDDPALEGVAAVLFDEFHERSLDADMGLALALDAQAGLREDLRILVMSATLDGARVAALLDDAPVIVSEGRAFPVETFWVGRDPSLRLEDDVSRTILRALADHAGSILVFLPGQAEINRVAAQLGERVRDPAVDIAPLYGAMDRVAQDIAVAPSPPGRRKVVLATSIAETSLTIEGVRVVIDSGFARVPRFEPDLGLTRLETVRVSRAAADQRRGRAGRTAPGVCLRMWEQAGEGALPAFAAPEILSADLSGLLLDLAAWGVSDPGQLRWLDPPPAPAVAEARALLRKLGALDDDLRITGEGRAMRALPLPPRWARMVVQGAEAGMADLAAEVALATTERSVGGDLTDIVERVERLRRDRGSRADEARRLARAWAATARRHATGTAPATETIGSWVARAFPDRVAKARGRDGEYLLANGRAASLEPHLALAREPWLAVAEIAGRAGASRILAAAAITPDEVETVCAGEIQAGEEVTVDPGDLRLRARRFRRLGAISLADQPMPVPPTVESAVVLARAIARAGIARLPWTKALDQRRERVAFLRRSAGESETAFPDLGDDALAGDAEDWLAPFLIGKTGLSDISPDDLAAALDALMPWDLQRRLDADAPTHFEAPTGSRVALDYAAEGGPVLAIRVQELYGLASHPSVAGGRIPLTLHLLSPAHRPIQITRDLPGFWRGSWAAVRSEMKGRYPRHLWPEDPARALPTTRAKPRGT